MFGKDEGGVKDKREEKGDPTWETKRRVLKVCRLMVVDVSTRLLIRRPYTLAELRCGWQPSRDEVERVYATDLD